MKRLSIVVSTLAVALILASPASAVVYWQENFDGYAEGSALNGQAGPNGMTWGLVWNLWADPEIGSMAATSVGGQDDTFGAGYWPGDTTGGPNNQGSHIHMGTKATSGMLYVDFDLHVGTGRQSAPQWTFRDTDANVNVGVAPDWVDNANGGFDPQTGLGLNDDSNMFWNIDITPETQDIHGSWVFDLDNKMVTFSFTSKQEPDKVATLSTGYSNDWFPDYIYLYNHAISSSGGMGYDNMCIASGPGECDGASVPLPPATDFEWKSADSGDWNTAGNWAALNGVAGSRPPGNQAAVQSSHHTATFGDAIGSQARTVFTDSAVSVNSVQFSHTSSYAVAGQGSVNMIVSTVGPLPTVGVTAGSHQFQAVVAIHADTTVTLASGTQLEMVNRLNLNDNTLTKSGDGTLLINSSFNMGGGTIVNNSGVIGGGGVVGGSLENTGGTVAPGNSSGVLGGADQVPEPASWVLAAMAILAGTSLIGRVWRR